MQFFTENKIPDFWDKINPVGRRKLWEILLFFTNEILYLITCSKFKSSRHLDYRGFCKYVVIKSSILSIFSFFCAELFIFHPNHKYLNKQIKQNFTMNALSYQICVNYTGKSVQLIVLSF